MGKSIEENITKARGEGSVGSGNGAMTDVRRGGQTVAEAHWGSVQSGVGGGGGETMIDALSGGQTVASATVDSSGSGGGGVGVAMELGGGESSPGVAPQHSSSASRGGQIVAGAHGKRLNWADGIADEQEKLRGRKRLANKLVQASESAIEWGARHTISGCGLWATSMVG